MKADKEREGFSLNVSSMYYQQTSKLADCIDELCFQSDADGLQLAFVDAD